MTIKSKTDLLTELASNFPDNEVGSITAAIFRTFIENILDSYPETAKIISKDASYELAANTDLSSVFVFNNETAATVSLLASTNYPDGFFCFFRAEGNGSVTITPAGVEVINGINASTPINRNAAFYLLFLTSAGSWVFQPIVSHFDFLKFLTGTLSGDDQGIIIQNGKFSVGAVDDPQKSVFGSGNSYPVPYAFHCDVANTSGLNISSAVDVTNELQSDNLSTANLFGGTTTGKYILVGSDYKIPGARVKIDTPGDINPDSVQGYYLKDSSPTWVESEYMSTNAVYPYNQKGRNIACCISNLENWRFGSDPADPVPVWDKVTLTINGTPITKYWAKIELVGDIVLDPLLEQMTLHTNKCVINPDGTTEYFGSARYPKTLVFGLSNAIPNNLSAPADQVVDYTSTFSAKYTDNKFANNAVDGFGLVQPIEVGMDTSIPLQLFISYYVDGTATGDIDFSIEVSKISDGFVYDGTAVPDIYEIIDTIDSDSNLTRRTAYINFPVSDLFPNDAILINIYRDATVGNTDDTLESAIVITNVALVGVFWRP